MKTGSNKLAYKSDHVTFDKITYEHDLKDFSFTFIELPKFNKTKEDQLSNIVEKWIYFFKYADETSEEDLQKIIGSDVIIGRDYDVLNQYNWSKEERFAYDQTKKHIDDYLSSIQQGKIEVAKTMLANNIDVNTIVKCTSLSISEIEELQN